MISAKRLDMDRMLRNLPGMRFFISSITAIRHANQIYPGIAYFFIFSRSDACNQEIIFNVLHGEDTEADVAPIQSRARGDADRFAKLLFTVVKDHDNAYVCEMVRRSNDHHVNQPSSSQAPEPSLPPQYPTRIVVADAQFGPSILNAKRHLDNDGLKCEVQYIFERPPPPTPEITGASDLTETITKVRMLMKLCDHALYRVRKQCIMLYI